ncbi:hypothetical protein HF1_11060 [Mycoplasma haemofelis str. Langford 1]|uniref:Uncharacterized protein n=1 Tax=Mycoplasma haemofelis (strain Langford 1) TaxID=941640 RepID=E8ZIZ3_MYCHL|nr:hypothetical protein [Mycoplasma haemofelis]CBY93114.1 hypothetical protein HF1_11060 [Mycoplasma haemofelis str. Langford 1]
MALSTAAKSAIGLGTAGGVASSAAGINYLITSKGFSISELVKSKSPNKRKLIKSSNGSEDAWQKSWKAYREEFNNSNKNPFSLVLTKGTVTSTNATQEFMSACETWESRNVKSTEDEDYKVFLKYCTRNTLMSDLVSENPRRKALTKSDTESNAQGWKDAWADYKKKNPYVQDRKGVWDLSDWSTKHNQDNAPVTFMTRCDTELKREYYDIEGEDYNRVISWCTENS